MQAERPERFLPDRPLPEQAFVPGRSARPPEPEGAPLDHPADEWRLDEDYLFGVDLYNAGFHWEAHETWEGIWRAAKDRDKRDHLQGLIQCAAAALKATMGQENGVLRLAARGTRLLEEVGRRAGVPHMGMEGERFACTFRAWAEASPGDARSRPPIRLMTRSRDLLGSVTDRRVQPVDTRFTSRPGYLLGAVGRAGYAGQVLVLDRAPAPEEVEDRFADARWEARGCPVRRLNLTWEVESSARWTGAAELRADARYEHHVVLRSRRAPAEPPLPEGIELRPIQSERDWDKLVALSLLIYGEQFGSSFSEFARWRYREFQRTLSGGSGTFWGAFQAQQLVASLGLFESETLLRFQEVQTHPRHRRRGICTALVDSSMHGARARHPRAIATIVAEAGSPSERIYRRLGFTPAGSQHWLSRPTGS